MARKIPSNLARNWNILRCFWIVRRCESCIIQNKMKSAACDVCSLLREGIACAKFWSQHTHFGVRLHISRDDGAGCRGNLTGRRFFFGTERDGNLAGRRLPVTTKRDEKLQSRLVFRGVLPVSYLQYFPNFSLPFRNVSGNGKFPVPSRHFFMKRDFFSSRFPRRRSS